MTDNLPTADQCREFTLLLGEKHKLINKSHYYFCSCGQKWYGKPTPQAWKNHIKIPTYDSPTILLKMREVLGEEKYSKFIYQLSSQYFDKNGITRIGQQARLINFLNDYIFNPAALIDKASEYCEKEGK